MRVLLTNDDGFDAQGIQALATALSKRNDTVWIVAPSMNQSGTSCSLTVNRTVALTQHAETAFSIQGSPADCMHIALTGLAHPSMFDVVLSGLNDGANLGDDAIHSGTLGAATQANLYGLPALACSLVERGWQHLDTAVACVLMVLDQLHKQSIEQHTPLLWNLNIPNQAMLPHVKLASVGRRTPSTPVTAIESPKGDIFYWLGHSGSMLPEQGNDMAMIAAGYASLSPITLDRTDYQALNTLKEVF